MLNPEANIFTVTSKTKPTAVIFTVFQRNAHGGERTFQLYDEREILSILGQHGLELVEMESQNKLGGVMYFTDPKLAKHCVFFMRKTN